MTPEKCGRSPGDTEGETEKENGENSAGRKCECPSPHSADPARHGTSYGS